MNSRLKLFAIAIGMVSTATIFFMACGGGGPVGNADIGTEEPEDEEDSGYDSDWGGGGNTGGNAKIGDPCRQNADCAEGYCLGGICTPFEQNTGCKTSRDCADTPNSPYCLTSSGECVECLKSTQCAVGAECIDYKCKALADAGDDDDDFTDDDDDVGDSGSPTDTGTPADCNPPCQEPTPYCKAGECKSCLETGCAVGNCNASTGRCTTPGEDTGVEDTGTEDTGEEDTGPVDTGPVDTGPPDTGPKECDPPCISPTPLCDPNGVCVGCGTEGCPHPDQICNKSTGYCDAKPGEQWDCAYDDECRTDEFCYLQQKPTSTTPPRFQCQTRRYYLGIGGTPCNLNSECDSQLCVQREGTNEKYCFGLCKTDAHCDDNFYCDTTYLVAGGTKYEITRGCVINPEDCEHDGDCSGDLVCTLGRKKGFEYAQVCKPPVGIVNGGLACLTDEDCVSGKCIIHNICADTREKCISPAQCNPGVECKPSDYCFMPCTDTLQCPSVKTHCIGEVTIGTPPQSFVSCANTDYFP